VPATFAELLTPVTPAEAEATVLGLLEAVGFPATSWQRFSVPRTLVKLTSELYSDARTGISNIVRSRLLDFATGDALTYLARHFFLVERAAAVATVGTFVFTDVGGAPYDIEPGIYFVRDRVTGKRYLNVTGGTLAVGGTLNVTFRAESPGSSYNIASAATLEFATTLEGVEVTNPADPGSGTWITTEGADEQTDTSLREACRNKWATLGAGTADAYIAWALEGAPTVTKVKVRADDPDGPGTVRVILATDSGGASASQVADADAVIQARRPVGLGGVTTVSATPVVVNITATVNVKSANADAYPASLETARQERQAALEIGEDVYTSALDDMLHDPAGVRNVVITVPPGDVVVADEEIAILNTAGVSTTPV
jgi:hypothetical protein